MGSTPDVSFRDATPEDLAFIHENLRGLAAVEGRPDAVSVTPARLAQLLFGETPAARCLILLQTQRPIGHAWVIYFYPTFTGEKLLYLEDLFIREAHRGRGVGIGAMRLLARFALEQGCAGLAWSVVEANTPAVRFYEKLGAERKTGELRYRLGPGALHKLAEEA
jgi:GNAT superfamily N-acetyltransferase